MENESILHCCLFCEGCENQEKLDRNLWLSQCTAWKLAKNYKLIKRIIKEHNDIVKERNGR